MEEPQIHMLAVKGMAGQVLNNDFLVEVFNNTVRPARQGRSLVPHLLGKSRRAADLQSAASTRRRSSRSTASTST